MTQAKPLAIIAAGQSNADGRVPISELPNEIQLPLRNCYYCSNYTIGHEEGKFREPLTMADLSERRWGFDLIPYYYITQVLHQRLYVMKCTEGGTSIDPTGDGSSHNHHWTTHFDELDHQSDALLLQFETIIKTCMAAQNQQLHIGAMLWHQGEADRASFSETAAHHYADNLKAVFDYCRHLVGNPKLPIICGTVSHRSEQYDQQVESALINLASADPDIYAIDLSNQTLLDPYHFDAKSSTYFGKCAYNCLIDAQVINAEKLPVGPVKVY